MNDLWQKYLPIVGEDSILQLLQISSFLKDKKILHVSSTKYGGGVAEILIKMVPLMQALGLDTAWEIIEGDYEFFECTKSFHNAIQGIPLQINTAKKRHYEQVNAENAERLAFRLNEADLVIVHDPQPAALIRHFSNRKSKWIWRCHIDASCPHPPVWKYLHQFITKYDAAIFSLINFVQPLNIPSYIIPPSIDPLSDKNIELDKKEITDTCALFGIDPLRPMILQVSRFDHFKDPLGVLQAYRLAKKFHPAIQLVYAGGSAADDPEGDVIFAEVMRQKGDDADIHLLKLPPDANRTINALQRASTIVLQKSLKEGFGLTVTEALWKAKPVIGGNSGGIKLQVIEHTTGFLVNTPEGASNRIRYFLQHPQKAQQMGNEGRAFVREKFLITRHLKEYLCLFASLLFPDVDRIELPKMTRN